MKQIYWQRAALAAAIGAILFTSSALPARADNLQQKLNQSQQKLNQLNEDYKDQQDKVASYKPQVEALRDSVAVLNNSIKREQKLLEEEQNNLKELEEEQMKLEEQRQQHVEHLGQYVKSSHEDGVTTYLEVLFDASSLSDFIDRADKIQVIVGAYDQLQKDIAVLNESLDRQKVLIQEKQDKIQSSLNEKEQTQNALQQTLNKQEEILAQLSKEEKAALNAAATARADVNRIQELIEHEKREAAYAAQGSGSSSKGNSGGGVVGTVKVSGGAQQILDSAVQHVGTPYVWGGTSPSGFDCSGFVQYVYRANGVSLSRTSQQQYGNGVSVSRSELSPGDLVFFSTYASGASHVGIYVGNNVMIHSGNRGVGYSDITDGYYGPRYLGARRVLSQ